MNYITKTSRKRSLESNRVQVSTSTKLKSSCMHRYIHKIRYMRISKIFNSRTIFRRSFKSNYDSSAIFGSYTCHLFCAFRDIKNCDSRTFNHSTITFKRNESLIFLDPWLHKFYCAMTSDKDRYRIL